MILSLLYNDQFLFIIKFILKNEAPFKENHDSLHQMKATSFCVFPYRHLVHVKIMQDKDSLAHLSDQWKNQS